MMVLWGDMWFVYIMIGNALWSIADVTMSMIVNRLERSPMVVGWYVGVVEVFALAVLYLLFDIQVVWIGYFFVSALFAYIGMLFVFGLLARVDVSVSSAAWVFMSIGIALGGMVFFQESWNLVQGLGACISVVGVLILSFWHKHVSLLTTIVWLAGAGLFYVPYFLIQKAALLAGIPILTVFFWPQVIQKVFAFCIPLLLPQHRESICSIPKQARLWTLGMLCLWVIAALLGLYVVTTAYSVGNASLVGVAENGQPFYLIAFAWIATLVAPKYAPRELITAQSFSVKIMSFCIVFTGLGMLALG